MPLDPSAYLEKNGWKKGQAFKKGGRVKPITIAQKTTLAGVGKDNFNTFNFWDALFDGVAKKIATGVKSEKPQLTSTGIYSPLAPSPSTPVEQQSVLSKHSDVIAQIEMSAAKTALYSSFRRGSTLEGSWTPPPVQEPIQPKPTQPKAAETESPAVERPKKRKMVEREDGTVTEETDAERAARRARKAAKRAKKTA